MNIKIGVLLFLFIFVFSFVSAQAPPLPFEDELPLANETEQIKEFVEERKWEYLGKQWKSFALNNTVIARIDNRLRVINPALFFIFGEDYDLSLLFLFVVILWIAFFVTFGEIFSLYGTFSKEISWALGFIFAVIIGHLRVYEGLSLVIFKIIFFREGIWGWVAFVIFFILYVAFLLSIKKMLIGIRKKIKKKREERAKKQAEFDREVIHKTAEAVLEGTGAKKK
ncbi:MAG: hypothetical protein IIA87_04815 [Nanoarchaeota archaeon]|nr:hypothetical protein [Nanoarchaeota archaeon]